MIGISGIGSHSWYGLHTHILRSDGKLERSKIGNIVFCPSGLYVSVSYKDHLKQTANKHVSLQSVILLNILWTNVDIVSDTELLIVDDKEFVPPPECSQLPILTVSTGDLSLSKEQNAVLGIVISEINMIIRRTIGLL